MADEPARADFLELPQLSEMIGLATSLAKGLELLRTAQPLLEEEIAQVLELARGTAYYDRTALLVRALFYQAQLRVSQQRTIETLEREGGAQAAELAEARAELQLRRASDKEAGEVAESARKARAQVTEYRMMVREMEHQLAARAQEAAEWHAKYNELKAQAPARR